MKTQYINLGNERIKLTEHNNGAISIEGPSEEGVTESFSYGEKDDDSHKDEVKADLERMVTNGVADAKQEGIDFIDNAGLSE